MSDLNDLKEFFLLPAPDEYLEEGVWLNPKGSDLYGYFWTNRPNGKSDPDPVRYEESGDVYYINCLGQRFDVIRQAPCYSTNNTRLAKTTQDFYKVYLNEMHSERVLVGSSYDEQEHYINVVLRPRLKTKLTKYIEASDPEKINHEHTFLAKRFDQWLGEYLAEIKRKELNATDTIIDDTNGQLDQIFNTKYLQEAKKLFLKLHHFYYNEPGKNVNYARIYFLMHRDVPTYITCTQTVFFEAINRAYEEYLDYAPKSRDGRLQKGRKHKEDNLLTPWQTKEDNDQDVKNKEKTNSLLEQYNTFKKDLGLNHI